MSSPSSHVNPAMASAEAVPVLPVDTSDSNQTSTSDGGSPALVAPHESHVAREAHVALVEAPAAVEAKGQSNTPNRSRRGRRPDTGLSGSYWNESLPSKRKRTSLSDELKERRNKEWEEIQKKAQKKEQEKRSRTKSTDKPEGTSTAATKTIIPSAPAQEMTAPDETRSGDDHGYEGSHDESDSSGSGGLVTSTPIATAREARRQVKSRTKSVSFSEPPASMPIVTAASVIEPTTDSPRNEDAKSVAAPKAVETPAKAPKRKQTSKEKPATAPRTNKATEPMMLSKEKLKTSSSGITALPDPIAMSSSGDSEVPRSDGVHKESKEQSKKQMEASSSGVKAPIAMSSSRDSEIPRAADVAKEPKAHHSKMPMETSSSGVTAAEVEAAPLAKNSPGQLYDKRRSSTGMETYTYKKPAGSMPVTAAAATFSWGSSESRAGSAMIRRDYLVQPDAIANGASAVNQAAIISQVMASAADGQERTETPRVPSPTTTREAPNGQARVANFASFRDVEWKILRDKYDVLNTVFQGTVPGFSALGFVKIKSHSTMRISGCDIATGVVLVVIDVAGDIGTMLNGAPHRMSKGDSVFLPPGSNFRMHNGSESDVVILKLRC